MHHVNTQDFSLPELPSLQQPLAVSDAALIEKLINFLKTSAVNPAPLPRERARISLNGWGRTAWLLGNIWSLKAPFMEYCLIKIKLRELYVEFNF